MYDVVAGKYVYNKVRIIFSSFSNETETVYRPIRKLRL